MYKNWQLLTTSLQNFTQNDLIEVKIFQKVLGGFFFETPCISVTIQNIAIVTTEGE